MSTCDVPIAVLQKVDYFKLVEKFQHCSRLKLVIHFDKFKAYAYMNHSP